MQTILVEPILHRDENRLLLKFRKDQAIIDLIRKLPNCRWSQTNTAWHVPDSPESKVELVKLTAKGLTFRWVDQIKVSNTPKDQGPISDSTQISNAIIKNNQLQNPPKALKEVNPSTSEISSINEIEQFKRYLTQRRYSASTIQTYAEGLKVFLLFTSKPVSEITNMDLVRFNHDYIIKNQYSSSFQNQVINAVKLFFSSIYNTKFDIDAVERPRREHKLPNVLSKEEIKRIITSPTNIKHRAMLSLIYACGLRRSELLHLKPQDIDSQRGVLIIRQAKGNKDRIVPVSEKTIAMLREYYLLYKPKTWLFEGRTEGEQYSETSLQEVLKIAVNRGNVRKPVTLHWLRHSYATHLLESGTDLRYIQELLGHKSSKTTEIYTHVTTQSIQKIKSPFDDL